MLPREENRVSSCNAPD